MAAGDWTIWTPLSALFGAAVGPFVTKLIERAFKRGQVQEALRDATCKELCDVIDELETLARDYWLPSAGTSARDRTDTSSRIVSRLHVCNQMIFELFKLDPASLGTCKNIWTRAHEEITGQDFGEPSAYADGPRLQAMSIELLNLKRRVITCRAGQRRPFLS